MLYAMSPLPVIAIPPMRVVTRAVLAGVAGISVMLPAIRRSTAYDT
jgi:hypothetical protein